MSQTRIKKLTKKQCTVAGVTKDGKVCYYCKKHSDDPSTRDLELWVTVGLPAVSGDNYCRLSNFGYSEEDHFAELTALYDSGKCKPGDGSFDAAKQRRIREFLATVTAEEINKHQFGDA